MWRKKFEQSIFNIYNRCYLLTYIIGSRWSHDIALHSCCPHVALFPYCRPSWRYSHVLAALSFSAGSKGPFSIYWCKHRTETITGHHLRVRMTFHQLTAENLTKRTAENSQVSTSTMSWKEQTSDSSLTRATCSILAKQFRQNEQVM